MATLQGLPPLPRSLQGLFQGGSAHWKETERNLKIRASIQQDIIDTQAQELSQQEGVLNGSPARRTTVASLQATLAQLRREMVSLRQVDMSLLCQLWSLNESIQEYKHLFGEPESISECSNYSLENGLDTIPSIEEELDTDCLSSSMDGSLETICQNFDTNHKSTPKDTKAPLTPQLRSQRSRTPPKQRPSVPPPAAPRAPGSPVPPPRTRTPPTKRASLPNVGISSLASSDKSYSLNRSNSQSKSPTSAFRTPPLSNAPPNVNKTPPPRTSTPPLPSNPPPVNRTTPTKRPTSVPQAPPRRSKGTPPRNGHGSPSPSIRSTISTTSSRSSAYNIDC